MTEYTPASITQKSVSSPDEYYTFGGTERELKAILEKLANIRAQRPSTFFMMTSRGRREVVTVKVNEQYL